MKLYPRYFSTSALVFLLTATLVAGDRGGNVRSTARSNVNNPSTNRNTNVNQNANVNRNTNVNQNTNVNRNTNVNVNRDVNVNTHGNYYGGGGCCYHQSFGGAVATAAAVTATAAIVGSMVNTLPPSCTVVAVNGISYQQCGNSWYQPQFSGGNTTYVVVNPPR
jgi:Family of unknown function (DUF6515)